MALRSVEELKNIRGKRVLVRVDFNVPVERGQLKDDMRIKAAAPTLKLLIKGGAKVILMTHFGRPGAKQKLRMKNEELRIITNRLNKLLNKKVQMVDRWDFKQIGAAIRKMKSGDVLILPNLRLHPGEEKNNAEFARELAALAQIYVNEAFSVCHRSHASIVGVPKFLPSYGGLRLTEEVKALSRVLHEPKRPLVVLIGGAKITDKIGVIRAFLPRATAVLVGGASANHFFKAMGYGVGASPIEPEGIRLARALLRQKKIILPRDVVVGTKSGRQAKIVEVPSLSFPRKRESINPRSRSGMTHRVICRKPYAILDIGPATIRAFAHYLKAARTLIWNGPMGAYEKKAFSYGTMAVAQLFAARSKGRAFGAAGGGETVDALRKTGMEEYVDFISTGGGAMLEFLSGKALPGLKVLSDEGRK